MGGPDYAERTARRCLCRAGSTGALHVGTSLIVRTVKGVKRPALATPMPGKAEVSAAGLRRERRVPPEMLNAFGAWAAVYAKRSWAAKTPAVALVNNGAEESKGTPIYRRRTSC